MSSQIKLKDTNRVIHEAILNDPEIQALQSRLMDVYNRIRPKTSFISLSGRIEFKSIDQISHPLLSKIEALIKSRKEQIIKALS